MARFSPDLDSTDQIVDSFIHHFFNTPTRLQELQRAAESSILSMLSDTGVFDRKKTKNDRSLFTRN